jgi:carboxyl-terminal processing protease
MQLQGIGAALQARADSVVVSKIITGAAADRHGKLKRGDQIVGVGQGAEGDLVEIRGKKLSDVVALIRGPSGSIVRLEVIPVGGDKSEVYAIPRGNIELKETRVTSRIIETAGEAEASRRKIGIIEIPAFYRGLEGARSGAGDVIRVSRDVTKALTSLVEEKVEAVILDLRNCEGDSIEEAAAVAGSFLDQGVVLQTLDAQARVRPLPDPEKGALWNGPLAVLTNRFTMGSGEMVAASLQDRHRALIVGDSATFGKGSIQEHTDLGKHLFRIPRPPNLGAMLITTTLVLRPTGHSIQQRGVSADIVLPSLTEAMVVGEKTLEHALPSQQLPSADFEICHHVTAELVASLRQSSQARCSASEGFTELRRKMAQIKKQGDRTSLSLHRAAHPREPDPLEIGVELLQDEASGGEPADDFYLQEVIAITVDYINALENRDTDE